MIRPLTIRERITRARKREGKAARKALAAAIDTHNTYADVCASHARLSALHARLVATGHSLPELPALPTPPKGNAP